MLSTSASVLVEYERAKTWLASGIAHAEKAELWNHRSYMNAHLAHVQWATGDWSLAADTAEQALADGRGGITTRITAEYVLGYLAMGRASWAEAIERLSSSLLQGESMNELQRIAPPLWGLAETALTRGEFESAVGLSERGFAASQEVDDAAYLFPFLVTGARARIAVDDVDGAAQWVKRVADVLTFRGIPGPLPAIAHANALLDLANGDAAAALERFSEARRAWHERDRFWEGSWAALDEARCLLALNQSGDARSIAELVKARASGVGALTLINAADDMLREASAPVERWRPLTAREFEVAMLVASGLTNREIAAELVLAPKTVSAHVEHILAQLGASRRTEIAAWAARIKDDPRISP
jgi:DNA-binding CsgD family transcriptional regulator